MNEEAQKKHGKLATEFTRLHSLVSGLSSAKQHQLLDLYSNDPFLKDLGTQLSPLCITSDFVESFIKLETGQAFPVFVEKFSGERIELVVSPESKVLDLKAILQTAIERTIPEHSSWRISWKGVWRKYCLESEGIQLENQEATLSSYGIKKNALIFFAKLKHHQKT